MGEAGLSISTVIPTHNRAHLVTRALESALPQMEPGDEIIVVDDGSTDDTERVLEPYGDRIRYLRTPNRGAGAARNHGVDRSTGDLIAFLDSDDEWMPGKIALQRALLAARPDITFAFTNMAVHRVTGEIRRRSLVNWHLDHRPWSEILAPPVAYSSIARLPEGIDDFPVHTGSMYDPMAGGIYIFTSTLMVRRKMPRDVLHFAEDLPTYEDWVCYGRISGHGEAAFLDVETAWQHGHTGPRLTTSANSLVRATTRMKVLERVWGADEGWLAAHGERYRRLMNEQRLLKIASLIALGRTGDARAELRLAYDAPAVYRVVAALPGPFVRFAVGVRGRIRTLLRGTPGV